MVYQRQMTGQHVDIDYELSQWITCHGSTVHTPNESPNRVVSPAIASNPVWCLDTGGDQKTFVGVILQLVGKDVKISEDIVLMIYGGQDILFTSGFVIFCGKGIWFWWFPANGYCASVQKLQVLGEHAWAVSWQLDDILFAFAPLHDAIRVWCIIVRCFRKERRP